MGEVLSVLADETRLGVVEVIGNEDGEDATLSYSAIRDRLTTGDTGNLSYHLGRLRDRFVERTDEGYRLTISGIRAYQAIASGRFEEERPAVPPTAITARCEECDERLWASYGDGRFRIRCADCDVRYHYYPISPNAFDETDVESLVDAALTRCHLDLRSMLAGVCPYCSSEVTRAITGEDTTGAGFDDRTVYADLSCTRCAWFAFPRVDMVAHLHYATATFYERHGRPRPTTQVVADGEWTTTVESDDPWQIRVDVTLDEETLRHVVDGDLNVVEWAVVE
jgi:hypothetical protein